MVFKKTKWIVALASLLFAGVLFNSGINAVYAADLEQNAVVQNDFKQTKIIDKKLYQNISQLAEAERTFNSIRCQTFYPDYTESDYLFEINADVENWVQELNYDLDSMISLKDIDGNVVRITTRLFYNSETKSYTKFGIGIGNDISYTNNYVFYYVDLDNPEDNFNINLDPKMINSITGARYGKLILKEVNTGYPIDQGDYVWSTLNASVPANFLLNLGTIVDDDNPIIEGTRNIVLNYVEGGTPFEDILSTISVEDPTEGDITSEIIIEENTYEYSAKTPGEYSFTITVSDSSGNITSEVFKIVVVDATNPIITGRNVDASYDHQLTTEELISLFTATDNYNVGLVIKIIEDNYTQSFSEKGVYKVVAEVTDLAGNTATASSSIHVVDAIKPIISVTKGLSLPREKFSLEEIRNYVTAVDGYDGILAAASVVINGNFLAEDNGLYKFSITATDAAGNANVAEMNVILIDADSPQINVNNTYTLYVAAGTVLSKEDILKVLVASGQIDESKLQNILIETEYLTNPGSGEYELKVTTADGTSFENSIIVGSQIDTTNNTPEIFTDAWWIFQWNTYCNNWNEISNWNWMQWTTLIIGGIVILGISYIAIKRIKK